MGYTGSDPSRITGCILRPSRQPHPTRTGSYTDSTRHWGVAVVVLGNQRDSGAKCRTRGTSQRMDTTSTGQNTPSSTPSTPPYQTDATSQSSSRKLGTRSRWRNRTPVPDCAHPPIQPLHLTDGHTQTGHLGLGSDPIDVLLHGFWEKLQRKAIALLPNHHQQRFTASILRNLEHEISRYVLTISVINALVGLIFSVLLLLLSIPLQEALLWGTVVALLNFAPYVGPLIGVLLMLLIGLVQFHESSRALLPALLYLMLHTLEGQLITPIILGHRMAISPLMLIVALLLFGSLWGLIGLLLAVPMLVCIKMVLSRIEDLQRWSRLLE